MREKGHKHLLWYGVSLQAGSCIGALAMFAPVNVYHHFKQEWQAWPGWCYSKNTQTVNSLHFLATTEWYNEASSYAFYAVLWLWAFFLRSRKNLHNVVWVSSLNVSNEGYLKIVIYVLEFHVTIACNRGDIWKIYILEETLLGCLGQATFFPCLSAARKCSSRVSAS